MAESEGEMARKRKMTTFTLAKERDTLKAICDLLDVMQAQGKCLYVRHNPYSPFTDHKTGKVRFRKPRATQVGAPDIFLWLKKWNLGHDPYACDFFIETKAPNGKLSPDQEKWKKMAEKMGIRYLTIRSIDEFMEVIR